MFLWAQLYIPSIMMDQGGSDMTNVDLLMQEVLLNNGRLWYKKEVTRSWVSNLMSCYSMGFDYLSMPKNLILVPKSSSSLWYHQDGWIGRDVLINTLKLRQNGSHFSDHIFKLIFLHEKCVILKVQFSFTYVLNALIDKPAMVQVTAWRWIDDKPLPGPVVV